MRRRFFCNRVMMGAICIASAGCGSQTKSTTDSGPGDARGEWNVTLGDGAAVALRADGSAPACTGSAADCNGDVADGCEVDLRSNVSHCGGCGRACAPGEVCQAGVCAASCTPPFERCGGSACVDVATDPDHCGGCDNACSAVANGKRGCASGRCSTACDPGHNLCAGHCIAESSASCGPSCTACAAPANGSVACVAGACQVSCDDGFVLEKQQCQPLIACLPDKDGDGYGSGAVAKSFPGTCPAGYVLVSYGGDCEDGNPDVFPGQTKVFGTGYWLGGTLSFDYDCDGVERQPEPKQPQASPSPGCAWTSGCKQVGAGYTHPQPLRSGPGVDPYCGSTSWLAPVCNAHVAIHCHLQAGVAVEQVDPVMCN